MIKIDIKQIIEPKLEFGQEYKSAFVKDALLTGCGPFAANFYEGRKTISLGLICTVDVEYKIRKWLSSFHKNLISNESNYKRFREFSGVEEVLKCRFEINSNNIKILPEQQLNSLASIQNSNNFEMLLELYLNAIESLLSDQKLDCILVYFPDEIASFRIANNKLSHQERLILEKIKFEDETNQLDLFESSEDQNKLKKLFEEIVPQAEELLYRSFYRALKAKSMLPPNSVPLQIIRSHSFSPDKSSQSISTIAWNTSIGMYYKAGNIPWRLNAISQDTCYVGISFHYMKKRSGEIMYASLAQAFSSSGEGFALKGENISKDQTYHKSPYLNSDQASSLIDKVLNFYLNKTGILPSRLVIHKTSRYHIDEIEGLKSAVLNRVPTIEFVWFNPSGFRLLRKGLYPPDRGILCLFPDGQNYLFTTGYIKKWDVYPGPHIPSPLEIGTSIPENIEKTAKEILALTKMNWNNAEALDRHPITLTFARRVGTIITELNDEIPNPSYRYYM
jgi:hypothetical protein